MTPRLEEGIVGLVGFLGLVDEELFDDEGGPPALEDAPGSGILFPFLPQPAGTMPTRFFAFLISFAAETGAGGFAELVDPVPPAMAAAGRGPGVGIARTSCRRRLREDCWRRAVLILAP